MDILHLLGKKKQPNKITIFLPASKSESNRALIIQALSQETIHLENLSKARDTQTMIQLLKSSLPTLDVLDAGTTMRFLTAYCVASQKAKILTGTARMQQRPIGILVDALRHLGANISYLKNEKFPPIQISRFEQKNHEVVLKADISSQYVSALLMIAPTLPKGLKIKLLGQISSKPYIMMTLTLMKYFGIKEYNWQDETIFIPKQKYRSASYCIESDWSGASYWYSIVALSRNTDLKVMLKGLKKQSFQGDQIIVSIMDSLGVKTSFEDDGILLSKKESQKEFSYNFNTCPDLAQTVAVICAIKGIQAYLKGLHSLPLKETNRLMALKTELEKFNVKLSIQNNKSLFITPSVLIFNNPIIETYEDHRMAMAFAPLSLLYPLKIKNPKVVNKSYPSFWEDLKWVVNINSQKL